jgi:hypothetical protein
MDVSDGVIIILSIKIVAYQAKILAQTFYP